MKFLCVRCDQPMGLSETHGPFDGTLSIVYECPVCSHRIAMLTNRAETQMVRSLGVKIGGRRTETEPMETLRSSLAVPRDREPEQAASRSKCPFTGVVSEAFAAPETPEFEWMPEAKARIEAIPPFIREMVQQNVEEYARQHGYRRIDEAVMDEVKGALGM
ncbi:MAG: PCP reductase family protein [Bacteroidota bacterium]|nr:PCP reductase family protein [Bacteroidota bacterium]